MKKQYDKNNVFFKILKGELSCKKIYEDEHVLAFNDINPIAKTHVLVISKEEYVDYFDFISSATKDEISNFFYSVQNVVKKLKIDDFSLKTNCGKKSGQVIFHFHVHLISNQ